tara:strand:- start:792 stop:1547 length:756 start_codon:yes stop_codon:yes gene_type:complete
MSVLPLFKSHYSLGKSILTLESPESVYPEGPDSIIKICKDNEISSFFLIEDNMSSFLQAYKNSCLENIKFNFGLRLTVCNDMEAKNQDELTKSCKYVIIANNDEGYRKLIKIYSLASQRGFYYEPRIDFKNLKYIWSEKDLTLCVPFYDSFLHKNSLHDHICQPDFDFTSPVFMDEDNDNFIDILIKNKIRDFCKDKYEVLDAKSIFYHKREDFKAYLTFRCINQRTTLDKPNFDHMTSREFCFESWKEKV